MKSLHLSMRGKRAVSGYLFILPFIIGFVVFMMVPLFTSLEMSFSQVIVTSGGFEINPYFGLEDTKYVTTRSELSPAAIAPLVGDAGKETVLHVDPTSGKVITRRTPETGRKLETTSEDAALAVQLAEVFGLGSNTYEVTIGEAQCRVTVDTMNGDRKASSTALTIPVSRMRDLVGDTSAKQTLILSPAERTGSLDGSAITDEKQLKALAKVFKLDKGVYNVTITPAYHSVTVVETIVEGDTYESVMEKGGFGAVVLDVLGLDNYVYALTVDPTYNQLLVEEITKIATHTIAIIVVSFVIAILLNQEFKGRAFVRAIFFLPVILSSGVLVNLESDNILMSGMQELISEQTPFTVTDTMMEILQLTGLGGGLLDVVFELIAEVYNIVMGSGIQIVVFLSGLQNVPKSLYEAADVEGCTKWEAFWMITFPMVAPLLIVNIIYTIVDFFTKMDGDLSTLLDENLLNFHYDRMSAMSWLYFAVTLAMIGLSALVLSKGVVSNDD